MISAINLFLKGERLLNEAHKKNAETKIHTLRGGSAGCMLPGGSTLGACPHEALGRFMGYEGDKTDSQGYFDGGIANELIWERNIAEAIKDHPEFNAMRCEEDIPVVYDLDGRYKITGRPDLVVGVETDGVFVPKLGTELKAAFGTGSAASRLFGVAPDTKHLCQAAFYMKVLDVPWTIPYTVNVTGDLSFWDKKAYGRNKLCLGKVEFPLEFRDNTLFVQMTTGEWKKTLITWEGILDYYRLIVSMYETQTVGKNRIADVDAFGEAVKFDYNIYNDFTNMVPVNQGWEGYMHYLKKFPNTRRAVKYSKKQYFVKESRTHSGPLFLAEGEMIGKFNSLAKARELAYEGC